MVLPENPRINQLCTIPLAGTWPLVMLLRQYHERDPRCEVEDRDQELVAGQAGEHAFANVLFIQSKRVYQISTRL